MLIDTPERLSLEDGTELAYGVAGAGPGLVLTNGVTTTVNFWERLHPRWSRGHRVIAWDMPGHGNSSPARGPLTARIEQQAEWVVRLMDAAKMDAAVQVGWSSGSQVALETYRRYPDRCTALVLLLGSAGRVLSTTRLGVPGPVIDLLIHRAPTPVFSAFVRLFARTARSRTGPQVARALGLIGRSTLAHDLVPVFEHLGRLHPRSVQTMIASAQDHSAWDLLPAIRVPVLIVAGDRDSFTPAATVGVKMHERCPSSELLRLPEATHTSLIDHADAIGAGVDDFLRRRVTRP